MTIGIVGGHLAPALAVLDEILPTYPVVFFGRKHSFEGDTSLSLEYQIMEQKGIPFVPITTARLQRKISKNTLPSLSKFPIGLSQALQGLKVKNVDIVLSFGGYLSLPVCVAARIKGIPVVIHEQTLEAGLANKIASRFAEKVCISWESSRTFFPKEKVILTGNPIRLKDKKVFDASFSSQDEALPLLYITGGSSGSHAVNVFVEGALSHLLEKYRIIHQTGDAKEFTDFDRLSQKVQSLSDKQRRRYKITKFVDPEEVGWILKNASIVVGRSGMNTITELMYYGTPALLIPLPYGQRHEQEKNAHFLERLGMAKIVHQDTLTSSILVELLDTMVRELRSYKEKADAAKHLVHKDAASKILTVLTDVFEQKTTQKREKAGN